MIKKNYTFFFVAISSLVILLSVLVEAQYPPLDQPPPIKPEWRQLVDFSKVPNAPVKKTAESCPPQGTDPFCDWSCTNCINNETDYNRCPSGSNGEKIWGITYDDGPSNNTVQILDHLKAINAKATFFVIGSRITENPDILKRTVAEGHQIAIHTWSHPQLTTLTNEEIIAELKWTETIIKDITGLTPKFMRPPFGDVDNRVRAICTALGYKVVIWDLDTNDWMTSDVPKDYDESWIVGNFTQWVKDPTLSTTSHISLEHDLYTLSALHAPQALDIVKGAGFTIESVSTCVNEAPYLESTTNITTTGATTASPTPNTNTPTNTIISNAQQSASATGSSTTMAIPSSYSSNSSSYSSLNIFVIAIVSIVFTFSPLCF